MSDTAPAVCAATLKLPPSAPRIRITAGPGSAAQKTWNLRRPVTLIGSRRPAHIVLHDNDISQAHCVIINTGREVVLKDLHTTAGTMVRKEKVDLTLLSDGDVIKVGDTTIQIAIQPGEPCPDDSGCGASYDDPLAFAAPIRIGLLHGDRQWYLQQCVALVGRHIGAAIRLDHEDVASRHAIVFRFQSGPALYDLGAGEDVLLNGHHCSLSALSDGDRISVASFGLQIQIDQDEGIQSDPLVAAIVPTPAGASPTTGRVDEADTGAAKPATADRESPASVDGDATFSDALQRDIMEAWDHLNAWSAEQDDASGSGATDDDAADVPSSDADALRPRERELDAWDARLRGKLYDVQRTSELIQEREQALDERARDLETQRRRLAALKQACTQRETDVARRVEELARREHVVAQRWARMRAARCPHCGESISMAGAAPGDTQAGS